MGGGASSTLYVADKEALSAAEVVQQMRADLDRVESFVLTVYAHSSRVESTWLVLASKLGHKAFAGFARSEDTEELLSLFLRASDLLTRCKAMDDEVLARRVDEIAARLLDESLRVRPLVHAALVDEFLSFSRQSAPQKALGAPLALSLVARLQNELVFLMARDLFANFVRSKHFKTWRAAEASHALATSVEDATAIARSRSPENSLSSAFISAVKTFATPSTSSSSTAPHSLSLSPARSHSSRLRQRMRGVLRPRDQVLSALSAVHCDELQHVLGHRDCWLTALLTAAEALPLSFSLSSATRSRPGFPLVFVNRFFEKLTGFSRQKVLGRKCGEFVQCAKTDPRAVQTMSRCLRDAAPCLVVLDNVTAAGRKFRNLVALKPLLDACGECVFVVGLQMDVSKEPDEMAKVLLMQELLNLVPGRVVVDPALEERERERDGERDRASPTATSCLPFLARASAVAPHEKEREREPEKEKERELDPPTIEEEDELPQ